MLFLSFVGLITYSSATAAGPSLPAKPKTPPMLRNTQNLIPSSPRRGFVPLPSTTSRITRPKITAASSQADVPFYSQFTDISSPSWQKVGCGIASLAMLIDHYSKEDTIDVDELLVAGIQSNAYVEDAGWSHAGLIALAQSYGLTGASHSLAHLTQSAAFAELENVLKTGPVMVSVHYTFEPTNPIPHLVVVNRVDHGRIYYNDPAEQSGNNSITVEKFKRAWKQRYIEIRPRT